MNEDSRTKGRLFEAGEHLPGQLHNIGTGNKGPENEDSDYSAIEEAYIAIIKNSLDLMTISVDGVCKYINPAGARLLGAEHPDEIIGQSIVDFIYADPPSSAISRLKRLDNLTETMTAIEQRLKRTDGSSVIVELSASPFIYQGRKALLILARDITKRKLIDEALRNSEERLKLALEATDNILWDWNIQKDRHYLSPRLYKLLGHTAESAPPGEDILSRLIHPDDKDPVRDSLDSLLAQRDAFRTEFRLKTHDGDWRWFLASAKVVQKNQVGQAIRVVGTLTDITIPKKAHEAITESESMTRALLNATNDAAALFNCEGSYIMVNETFARRFNRKPDDFIGKKAFNFMSFNLAQGRMSILREVVRTGMPIRFQDRRAGLHLENTMYPVNDAATGQITMVALFSRDISEQVKAQTDLSDYQEKLRGLATELSVAEEKERRKIAIDLHDSVGQMLAVAQIKLSTFRRNLEGADNQTRELGEILDLIAKAAAETRSLTCEIHPPSLYDLGLEVALDEFAEHIGIEHGIVTELIDDGLLKPLDQDTKTAVFRIARELIINVAKHARARHMFVSVAKEGGMLVIEVNDDGVGFDKSTALAPDSRNRSFGLISVKERLTHLGGELIIDSTPGEGARMTIKAPLQETG